ncbi:hypothetical protein MTX20_32580 [Bradyrhizobium sp. ISRA435]|nr:hypothetical protein MTX20_32580 [Bradyrhizobium sp. ISRA435]
MLFCDGIALVHDFSANEEALQRRKSLLTLHGEARTRIDDKIISSSKLHTLAMTPDIVDRRAEFHVLQRTI